MQFFNKVMEINFLNTNNWPLLLKEQDLMNKIRGRCAERELQSVGKAKLNTDICINI